MSNPRHALSRFSPLIAALVFGAAGGSPAVAATLDALTLDVLPQPTRDLLLLGALVLLAAALAMRIYHRRHASDPAPEGPDLRWWKKHASLEA